MSTTAKVGRVLMVIGIVLVLAILGVGYMFATLSIALVIAVAPAALVVAGLVMWYIDKRSRQDAAEIAALEAAYARVMNPVRRGDPLDPQMESRHNDLRPGVDFGPYMYSNDDPSESHNLERDGWRRI